MFVRYAVEQASNGSINSHLEMELIAVPKYCNFKSADIVSKVNVHFGHLKKRNNQCDYFCRHFADQSNNLKDADKKAWFPHDMEELSKFVSDQSTQHLFEHPGDLYKEEDLVVSMKETSPLSNRRSNRAKSQAIVHSTTPDRMENSKSEYLYI